MGEDHKSHTYYYNATVEQALMDKIAELIRLHMTDVNIWLVGSWIWVLGATRPYKDSLKAMGLWWNGSRKAWSFHLGHWNGGSSPDSLSGLARSYGLRDFTKDSAETGVAA
jgi:hypothetical protein